MSEHANEREAFDSEVLSRNVEKKIIQAIKSLSYGSVEIIIHDSKVVQIERREKIRIER